jgi:acetylornithine deacetylase
VAVKDPWLRDNRPVVTWPGGQFASGWLDDDHSLIGEMNDAVTALGAPSPRQAAGVYGSDMRLYTAVGGVPTLHYGPGDFRLAHAPMERVELDELFHVTRSLLVLAMRRCGAVA